MKSLELSIYEIGSDGEMEKIATWNINKNIFAGFFSEKFPTFITCQIKIRNGSLWSVVLDGNPSHDIKEIQMQWHKNLSGFYEQLRKTF